jgi:hypothetical protein
MEEMINTARKDRLTYDIGAAIEGAALDFYQKSDRERSAVPDGAPPAAGLLAMRSVPGHDFDLADLARSRRCTVYLCLPASRMGFAIAGWISSTSSRGAERNR